MSAAEPKEAVRDENESGNGTDALGERFKERRMSAADSKRMAMRYALARRMKQEMLSETQTRVVSQQANQYSEFDRKLQEAEEKRRKARQNEERMLRDVQMQKLRRAQNMRSSAEQIDQQEYGN